MAANRLTIRLEGSEADSGHVRLTDFLEQLEAVKEALKQTERLITGEHTASVYYRIIDLRHSSPATVVLEAVSARPSNKPARVINTFIASMGTIQRMHRAPRRIDLAALQAYRNVGVPLERQRVGKVTLANTKRKVALDPRFSETVDEIIVPDEVEMGSISGRLEARPRSIE